MFEVVTEGPAGIAITYTGYDAGSLSPTVRVRCKVHRREEDRWLVRPATALPAKVWVNPDDVETVEGSGYAWLNCFLDGINDGWVYITMPTSCHWRRVVVPFDSVKTIPEPLRAVAY